METTEKPSRRDALRRMAKASMQIGMGLQLAGAFVPTAHAVLNAAQGARFSTIGHVSSPAIGAATAAAALNASQTDCYTNGSSYNNSGTTFYSNYRNGTC